MIYEYDGTQYPIVIIRKNNKNIYIRVNDDLEICATTGYFTTKHAVYELINNNKSAIDKMLKKRVNQQKRESKFYYLGQVYDIIIVPTIDEIMFDNNKIYVKSNEYLNKWLKKEIIKLFNERLQIIYPSFTENIAYPNLKIRKMKSRWGVCNRRNVSITLNSNLINYDISKLDYVIVHELSHFVNFNHSATFWLLVSKHCPNYKMIRKELKD